MLTPRWVLLVAVRSDFPLATTGAACPRNLRDVSSTQPIDGTPDVAEF
jgi:hypothetical protein